MYYIYLYIKSDATSTWFGTKASNAKRFPGTFMAKRKLSYNIEEHVLVRSSRLENKIRERIVDKKLSCNPSKYRTDRDRVFLVRKVRSAVNVKSIELPNDLVNM